MSIRRSNLGITALLRTETEGIGLRNQMSRLLHQPPGEAPTSARHHRVALSCCQLLQHPQPLEVRPRKERIHRLGPSRARSRVFAENPADVTSHALLGQ